MAARPDPRAELKAFAALALDMARIDPDRRPSADVRRWHGEIADALGLQARLATTYRALMLDTLRLQREVDAARAQVPAAA